MAGASRTGCAVILALLATAGACGGGGEPVKPDASRDMAADMAITPDTGTPPDTGMPDRPAKPLGDPCASSAECGSGQCVEGVCCNEACNRACFTCVNPGTEGTCLPAFQGTDPGDRCPTEAATTCGTTGVCDGTGACARFSGNAGVVCAAEACVGFMRTTTGTCDSTGGCSGATTLPCTPFQCAPDGKTCRTTCTSDADCVAPNSCVGGQLRQEADRRHLRQRRRVQLDVLRAGQVLRHGVHRDVPLVRGGGQRGDLPQRPRRPGPARPVRR